MNISVQVQRIPGCKDTEDTDTVSHMHRHYNCCIFALAATDLCGAQTRAYVGSTTGIKTKKISETVRCMQCYTSSDTAASNEATMSIAIPTSLRAKRTSNPIRNIVDNLKPPINHPKPLLNLALGDPTIHGNLNCPNILKESINDLLISNASNGYLPSYGSATARRAIATYTSTNTYSITEEDVVIASGCSGAIELAISALLDEHDTLIVPCPGFPLYKVITESLGGNVQYYNLDPAAGWNCDLVSMENAILASSRVKGILITNPSNPCGSNFSKEHLLDIVLLAKKYQLPILADEIYGGCVYDGEFTPIYSISSLHHVPVLSFGGIAKEFVVPGWRVGWVTIHDSKKYPRLDEVRAGLRSLSQLIVGANSLMQGALPRILTPVIGSKDHRSIYAFKTRYMDILRCNTKVCVDSASNELSVIPAKGAMYIMVGINFSLLDDSIQSDEVFAQRILIEENLFLLPGTCFGISGYVRLVISAPSDTIIDAFERLQQFCNRHSKTRTSSNGNDSNNSSNINSSSGNGNEGNDNDIVCKRVKL